MNWRTHSCDAEGIISVLVNGARTPRDFAPFTRVMPAASSGASSPLSAASTASFRTAVMRTLIEADPNPRASRATRRGRTGLPTCQGRCS